MAPNASPMTFEGTNTYILGSGRVAVIDPGPDDPSHLDAILAALDPAETVSHIFVTHSHLDHSPLARRLGDTFRTPILGFGAAHEGRSDLMQELALRSDLGGGEGIDDTFAPDQRLSDAEIVIGSNWSITAVHTPGHLANHQIGRAHV